MTMERKMMAVLEKWKDDPDKKALLVKGAGQVGKTYIIDAFGASHYKYYVKLDMKADTRLHDIFQTQDAESVIFRLTSVFREFHIEEGQSLVFIDEIQECPNAIMAMKPLVADGRLHIIGSGSMLGVQYKPPRSYPVGYVHEIEMHALDFEEYLWALGMSHDQTEDIRKHVSEKEPFDPYILRMLKDCYRQYLIIGSMPKPVSVSLEKNGLAPVFESQDDIINGYRKDMIAYTRGGIRINVQRMFELIPDELSRVNKRFYFKDIEDRNNVGIREYQEPVDWLDGSGYVNICYRLNSIERPLKSHGSSSIFKMYLMDTGLLVNMYGNSTEVAMSDDDTSVNEGAITENSVCEMLTKCGIRPFYYEKPAEVEVDFIAEIGKDLCAIEVKSGKKRRAKSLKKLMALESGKNITRWIKFEYSNIMVTEDGVEHYPLFCAAFADSLSEVPEIKLLRADPNMIISPDRGS